MVIQLQWLNQGGEGREGRRGEGEKEGRRGGRKEENAQENERWIRRGGVERRMGG